MQTTQPNSAIERAQENNQILTQVGPGTAMGTALRRFWIPALLSSEIAQPDSAPVRLRILGEDLVAFRDTTSKANASTSRTLFLLIITLPSFVG